MGSSPSNQKKSHVTLSSSTADVVPADVQDARTLPHVTRSNGAFSTQLGSHVNMGDDTIVTVTRLSDSQQRMVRICLGELETDLEITLNCGKLMNCIKVVMLDPGMTLLSPDTQQDEGIFIIEEGVLEVCTIGKLEPVARLLKGDFCGELTALFGGRATATVQCHLSGPTKCLFLSAQDLQCHWLDGSLNENVKFLWCVKRCYIDFTNLFPSGKLASQILCTAVQANALFSDWNDESISMLISRMKLVLFSDGVDVIARDHVTYQLFFFLRGSITMVAGDGTSQPKCVKSIDEGHALLTKEFFTGQPSKWTISCNAPTVMSCLSKEDIITTVTKYSDLSNNLTNKIASL